MEKGDIEVHIGLLNEHGDVSFSDDLYVNDWHDDCIEVTHDVSDLKKFKNEIKKLYPYSKA
jgi:hypothetical protein